MKPQMWILALVPILASAPSFATTAVTAASWKNNLASSTSCHFALKPNGTKGFNEVGPGATGTNLTSRIYSAYGTVTAPAAGTSQKLGTTGGYQTFTVNTTNCP